MKRNWNVLLFLGIIAINSCSKTIEKEINTDGLIGCWVNGQVNDSIISFERSVALKDNDYGFEIAPDGKFTERKNSGWCGTPPIAYADFGGTWAKKDSVISITVEYWGGLADYQWKIIAIDNKKLSVLRLNEEYHYSE